MDRVRKPGAGRRRLTETDPTLQSDLDALINPVTRGDPESALRWTSKSTQKLAQELRAKGHTISDRTVSQLLREAGYSLQANQKVVEGAKDHPDRDLQFQWIAGKTAAFQAANQPVISVDAKKRNWSESLKIAVRSGNEKGSPIRFRSMISLRWPWGKRRRMASTILRIMKAGSASVPTMTRLRSQPKVLGGGGITWGRTATLTPNSSTSRPMVEGVLVRGIACGRCPSKPWPIERS